MSGKTFKVIVVAIALAQLMLAQLVANAEIFKLGPVAVTTLGIVSASLTLLANYLPGLFGDAPAASTPSDTPKGA